MELKDLVRMTVVKLREEAAKFEDVTGTHGMTKEQLIDLLCAKLNIPKKQAPPKGIGRHALKEKIHKLRRQRDEVLASGDRTRLRVHRRRIKSLRRRLRKVIKLAAHGKVKAAPAKGPAPQA